MIKRKFLLLVLVCCASFLTLTSISLLNLNVGNPISGKVFSVDLEYVKSIKVGDDQKLSTNDGQTYFEDKNGEFVKLGPNHFVRHQNGEVNLYAVKIFPFANRYPDYGNYSEFPLSDDSGYNYLRKLNQKDFYGPLEIDIKNRRWNSVSLNKSNTTLSLVSGKYPKGSTGSGNYKQPGMRAVYIDFQFVEAITKGKEKILLYSVKFREHPDKPAFFYLNADDDKNERIFKYIDNENLGFNKSLQWINATNDTGNMYSTLGTEPVSFLGITGQIGGPN